MDNNACMRADDFLKQYLPDFDTAAKRAELQAFAKSDLIEMLLEAYKSGRVMAMLADELGHRLDRIHEITEQPQLLPSVDQPPPNFPEA